LSLVKLLFDENLSPTLVRRLAGTFPDSAHVHDCDLGASDDDQIWQFAVAHSFAIISKDLDFCDRSILHGSPPKLIWLRTGNCSTLHIESLLRTFAAAIHHFDADPTESLLILP
jgi:predicted nuclease of predicted toxin-antitoxin system